ARKTAGPAISSARPQRAIGTLTIVAAPPSGVSHMLRFRSVAVQPGQSALTRTPLRPHSTARVLVSPTTAALAAPGGAENRPPRQPRHRGDVDHRAGAAGRQVRAGRLADPHRRVKVEP